MCLSLNDSMYARCASVQLIRIGHIILVCLRFHSKLPQAGCSNSRDLFSHSSRGWKCEIRERPCLGSGDSLLPGLWRTMFWLYLCFVGVEWPRGETFCPVTSLFWGHYPHHDIPILMSSCNQDYCPKITSPNVATKGSRSSVQTWRGQLNPQHRSNTFITQWCFETGV